MLAIILIILSAAPNNVLIAGSRGSEALEIENDIDLNETPDPNVSYHDVNDNSTEEYDNIPRKEESSTTSELVLTKILLNGTNEEIRLVHRDLVIQSLGAIDKIQISLNKKLIIWEIIKNNKSVSVLERSDLVRSGKLLLIIPEIDLYNLNYSNWEIVDYLGTLSGITRRRTGIIGYALKRVWGSDIITKIEYINRMKGILCAFSPQELFMLNPVQLCDITEEVFQNLKSCTKRQLQVLINTATLTTAYGPIQSWNMSTTAKLGLLIKALDEEELKLIRPEAMEGISHETIEAIPREKLALFDEDQISFLDDLSLAAYRRLTGIDSNRNNYCRKVVDISESLYYEVLLISCVMAGVY